jgi:hypothetical protein
MRTRIPRANTTRGVRQSPESEIAMTSTALSNVTLPAEKEVEAAVQGQRALAAFLAAGFETQRIQIFEEINQAHQVELRQHLKHPPVGVDEFLETLLRQGLVQTSKSLATYRAIL